MLIYKIQNKINGKIYIGQTKKNLNERICEHLHNKSYIGNALKKYGLECFDISVIDTADTKEWLNDKEIEYIALYNCKHPNGYNLTDGGEGINGLAEESIQKLKNWERTKEYRKKLSIAQTGKKQSESSSQKKREAMTGKKIPYTPHLKARGRKNTEKFKLKHKEIMKEIANRKEVKEKRKKSHLGKPWSKKQREAYNNRTEEQKEITRKKQSENSKGEKHSQYGSYWITNGEINIKKKKNDNDRFSQ